MALTRLGLTCLELLLFIPFVVCLRSTGPGSSRDILTKGMLSPSSAQKGRFKVSSSDQTFPFLKAVVDLSQRSSRQFAASFPATPTYRSAAGSYSLQSAVTAPIGELKLQSFAAKKCMFAAAYTDLSLQTSAAIFQRQLYFCSSKNEKDFRDEISFAATKLSRSLQLQNM